MPPLSEEGPDVGEEKILAILLGRPLDSSDRVHSFAGNQEMGEATVEIGKRNVSAPVEWTLSRSQLYLIDVKTISLGQSNSIQHTSVSVR